MLIGFSSESLVFIYIYILYMFKITKKNNGQKGGKISNSILYIILYKLILQTRSVNIRKNHEGKNPRENLWDKKSANSLGGLLPFDFEDSTSSGIYYTVPTTHQHLVSTFGLALYQCREIQPSEIQHQ